jgi:sirohydrochlorin ferrochelatase
MAQPLERTAVLLIAHGSRQAQANDDLHQLAARFAERADHPIVEACFLELAEPDIAAGGACCVARGASRVLMVPYFLSAGVHLVRDLTAARDELQRRHPNVEFRLGPALGPHPLLDDLVAERIRQTDTDDSGAVFTSSDPTRCYAPATGQDPSRVESVFNTRSSSIDTNPSKG